MKKTGNLCRAIFLLAAMVLFPPPADAGEVRLSVAASLKDAVTDLCDAFSKAHPGVTFQRNTGASGALAKQVESGAPTDIFLSANLEWMDYLKEKGIVDGRNVGILAYNSLVFVGRPGLDIKTLNDIVPLERIAVASPGSAPAGEYAMSALSKAGLAGRLEKKLVMAKDVRECLMYAERGEVDGAFVYASDAKLITDRIRILFTVPRELYPRVTYPMGLTGTGAGNEDARAFFSFLKAEEARAILTKYGFILE